MSKGTQELKKKLMSENDNSIYNSLLRDRRNIKNI